MAAASSDAWPGAAILELPDLSSVHLEARLEEADRGRFKAQQDATVRIEALPGRDFKARINHISVLARVDFSSGWPPSRNFDLNLILLDADPKIRPGMTAVARIATERQVPRAQVALAWVASRPGITAPIIGATKPHHISDAVAALDLVMTDAELQQLETAYEPHDPAGF